jgi:thiamine-phosphate pyrophosphorylase
VSGPSGGAQDWGLAARRLYLCTPDRPDIERFVGRCVEGGVDIVQLREKHLPDAGVVARAALVQRVCAGLGVPFILNDRPDLAAEVGADGVHVGQDDPTPEQARAVVGEEALVGLSTHAPDELERAVGSACPGAPAPVDYLSAGPVVPTPTKPGRSGTGLGYVGMAAAQSPWPVWVTGGVIPDRVDSLVASGARHFVVVRWLTTADDPRSAARSLRDRIDRAISSAGSEPVGSGDPSGTR